MYGSAAIRRRVTFLRPDVDISSSAGRMIARRMAWQGLVHTDISDQECTGIVVFADPSGSMAEAAADKARASVPSAATPGAPEGGEPAPPWHPREVEAPRRVTWAMAMAKMAGACGLVKPGPEKGPNGT